MKNPKFTINEIHINSRDAQNDVFKMIRSSCEKPFILAPTDEVRRYVSEKYGFEHGGELANFHESLKGVFKQIDSKTKKDVGERKMSNCQLAADTLVLINPNFIEQIKQGDVERWNAYFNIIILTFGDFYFEGSKKYFKGTTTRKEFLNNPKVKVIETDSSCFCGAIGLPVLCGSYLDLYKTDIVFWDFTLKIRGEKTYIPVDEYDFYDPYCVENITEPINLFEYSKYRGIFLDEAVILLSSKNKFYLNDSTFAEMLHFIGGIFAVKNIIKSQTSDDDLVCRDSNTGGDRLKPTGDDFPAIPKIKIPKELLGKMTEEEVSVANNLNTFYIEYDLNELKYKLYRVICGVLYDNEVCYSTPNLSDVLGFTNQLKNHSAFYVSDSMLRKRLRETKCFSLIPSMNKSGYFETEIARSRVWKFKGLFRTFATSHRDEGFLSRNLPESENFKATTVSLSNNVSDFCESEVGFHVDLCAAYAQTLQTYKFPYGSRGKFEDFPLKIYEITDIKKQSLFSFNQSVKGVPVLVTGELKESLEKYSIFGEFEFKPVCSYRSSFLVGEAILESALSKNDRNKLYGQLMELYKPFEIAFFSFQIVLLCDFILKYSEDQIPIFVKRDAIAFKKPFKLSNDTWRYNINYKLPEVYETITALNAFVLTTKPTDFSELVCKASKYEDFYKKTEIFGKKHKILENFNIIS